MVSSSAHVVSEKAFLVSLLPSHFRSLECQESILCENRVKARGIWSATDWSTKQPLPTFPRRMSSHEALGRYHRSRFFTAILAVKSVPSEKMWRM
jgi:hypothetical protein